MEQKLAQVRFTSDLQSCSSMLGYQFNYNSCRAISQKYVALFVGTGMESNDRVRFAWLVRLLSTA